LGIYLKGTIDEDMLISHDVYIIDNVTVNSNVTLTIGPGCRIKFNNGKYIKVFGNIYANGEEGKPIIFTSSNPNPSPGDWYGIVVEDGGEIELNHAKVEYATYGVKSSYADV